jgi:hypothetical protein
MDSTTDLRVAALTVVPVASNFITVSDLEVQKAHSAAFVANRVKKLFFQCSILKCRRYVSYADVLIINR